MKQLAGETTLWTGRPAHNSRSSPAASYIHDSAFGQVAALTDWSVYMRQYFLPSFNIPIFLAMKERNCLSPNYLTFQLTWVSLWTAAGQSGKCGPPTFPVLRALLDVSYLWSRLDGPYAVVHVGYYLSYYPWSPQWYAQMLNAHHLINMSQCLVSN